jgi:serpin B
MALLRSFKQTLTTLLKGKTTLPAADERADMSAAALALAHGNTQFALHLHQQISARGGNILCSPFSISAALAMTCAGARGETAQEMASALRFPSIGPGLDLAFRELLQATKGGESWCCKLELANGLWSDRQYRLLPEFLERVKANYGAELAELDFAGHGEASRRTINAWVEKQTRGKICDLIPRGAIGQLAKLVLANAIYFHGQWATSFVEELTEDAPFKVTPRQEVRAPMMFKQSEFEYLGTSSFQALTLAYEGGHLAMVIFLPRRVDGLDELERSLSAESLDSWLRKLERRDVKVYLPKFRVESAFTLNEELAALDVRLAFSPDADFSGMTGEKDLLLSLVLHKAFVEVDEKGTEAAAATALMAPLSAAPNLRLPHFPPVFRADHPFLFLIRDQHSGSILFLGRLTNPKL